MNNPYKYIFPVVLAMAVIAALAFGSWQFGWFLKEDAVGRETEIDNTRTGTQDAWRTEAIRTIRDIAVLPEDATAQRAALTNQACDLIAKLTDQFMTDDLAEFAQEEC